MLKKSRLTVLLALLLVFAGCSGIGVPATTPQQTPAPETTTSTSSESPSTTAPETTTLRTTATTSTSVITDRTPTTRLHLYPERGFNGTITVSLDGDEVYNQTFTNYTGSADTDVSDEFRDNTGYDVFVVVRTANDTNVWSRSIGRTEGYKLTIHHNGTISVKNHLIG